jgi:putative nucleotidyltransferase with HDIG domain
MPRQPESYAKTGLPLFIQALCDAGASKARLEACIAGGALMGPLSEQDLALDIGGRTVEVVERILNREEIPICKSETGGYFSCRLSLNLDTWGSHIEPVGVPSAPSAEIDFKRPTSKQLNSAIKQVRPIPQVTLKIIRMIRDDKHSMHDVGEELRQDQIISGKVIRLCNSALVASKTKIDSVDRALVILGDKLLLRLVVSASLEDFFPETQQGYSLCKGGLYKHALGTAMLAEKLANFTGRVPADGAYTAGLLHDIGKTVLDQHIAGAYPLFYRRTQLDGVNVILVEREAFGVAHTEVGARLAECWSLPERLTDTIRHHHQPEQATVKPELTHLVYLADLLMSRFLVGQELDRLDTNALALSLKKMGLRPSQLPVMVDLIPREIFKYALPRVTIGGQSSLT